MTKIILLFVISFLLAVGCASKPLTNNQLEEVYRKRHEAYERYIIKQREKAVALLKSQKEEVEKEKGHINIIIKDLEDNIENIDFLNIIKNERQAYLDKIKNLTEEQIKELSEYLDENMKILDEKYLAMEKEKADLIAKQEEEKRLASILKGQTPAYTNENNNNIIPTVKDGIIIVNKKHPLPSNYSPGEDAIAGSQLRILIKDMQNSGYDISDSYSGYRSYEFQKELYERYVYQDGIIKADTYSARPGHSEHQTGLTFDLRHYNGSLVQNYPEVQWIVENAANYGFIVRYQTGKEIITGYQAEPWHLRYIGVKALDIYNSGLTLEEYLGVEGGDYYD